MVIKEFVDNFLINSVFSNKYEMNSHTLTSLTNVLRVYTPAILHVYTLYDNLELDDCLSRSFFISRLGFQPYKRFIHTSATIKSK